MALDVDWRQRLTNKQVYQHLPRITSKIHMAMRAMEPPIDILRAGDAPYLMPMRAMELPCQHFESG